MTPQEAYEHARNIIKGRFPAGEPAISADAEYAYWYARDVIGGRFLAGEPAIATSAHYAYLYAGNIIEGRWSAGEPVIAANAEYAYWYARDIIKGRFPEGEPVIATDAKYAYRYARDVIKGRFPAGEPVIATNAEYAYMYAADIIKGRFPAGEPAIATDAKYAYRYAKDIIEGRFPAGEGVIANSKYAKEYMELTGILSFVPEYDADTSSENTEFETHLLSGGKICNPVDGGVDNGVFLGYAVRLESDDESENTTHTYSVVDGDGHVIMNFGPPTHVYRENMVQFAIQPDDELLIKMHTVAYRSGKDGSWQVKDMSDDALNIQKRTMAEYKILETWSE